MKKTFQVLVVLAALSLVVKSYGAQAEKPVTLSYNANGSLMIKFVDAATRTATLEAIAKKNGWLGSTVQNNPVTADAFVLGVFADVIAEALGADTIKVKAQEAADAERKKNKDKVDVKP